MPYLWRRNNLLPGPQAGWFSIPLTGFAGAKAVPSIDQQVFAGASRRSGQQVSGNRGHPGRPIAQQPYEFKFNHF